MIKKFFEKTITLWYVWPLLFMAGCACYTLSFINDCALGEFLGAVISLLSLLLLVSAFVVAVVFRHRGKAIAGGLAVVACMAVGLLTCILIGVGQHHPPHYKNSVVIPTWTYVATTDTAHVQELTAMLDGGSWWTDGRWFYEVKQTGQTIRLEGYGLHEGGAVCGLQQRDGKWFVALPAEGYTTFAKEGCEVRHYLIRNDDASSYDVLVAFVQEADELRPWRVLQRVKGKGDEWMLAFVKQCIFDVLSGIYVQDGDNSRQWIFLANGTVQVPGMEKAQPYQIELGYDLPTGVIRLPDGSRVGVVRGINSLQLYQANYDQGEEFWTMGDSLLHTLQVADPAKSLQWTVSRPAMMEMFGCVDSTYQMRVKESLTDMTSPVAVLNRELLPFVDDDAAEEMEEETLIEE